MQNSWFSNSTRVIDQRVFRKKLWRSDEYWWLESIYICFKQTKTNLVRHITYRQQNRNFVLYHDNYLIQSLFNPLHILWLIIYSLYQVCDCLCDCWEQPKFSPTNYASPYTKQVDLHSSKILHFLVLKKIIPHKNVIRVIWMLVHLTDGTVVRSGSFTVSQRIDCVLGTTAHTVKASRALRMVSALEKNIRR